MNSIIVTPYMTPVVTKLVTGLGPDSDAFKMEQLTLVRNFLESLASDLCQDVGGDPPGSPDGRAVPRHRSCRGTRFGVG